jgi:hypothetical protein
MSNCVVLFSGGTDSLCSAALAASKHDHVHLLTFYEESTKASPWPMENLKRLQNKYGVEKFSLHVFSTDKIVRKLSYQDYFKNLKRFHLYNIATPGLSSLSWHTRTIRYCLDHGIKDVYDGMTKELLHLPGHMPEVREHFTKFYKSFGISFSSMVIDWDVPEDQRFMDRLIVDRHGFTILPERKTRTTGEWLFENGILPHKNVKGSEFDRMMQHDCYPFIVYNMLVFWLFEPWIGFDTFKVRLQEFIADRIEVASQIVNNEQLVRSQDEVR